MSSLLNSLMSGFLHAHGGASRSAMKTASYALMHLVVAMAVAFALTRDWRAALAIGLVEPMVQTLAYTLHERAWSRSPQRDGAGSAVCAHQGVGAP